MLEGKPFFSLQKDALRSRMFTLPSPMARSCPSWGPIGQVHSFEVYQPDSSPNLRHCAVSRNGCAQPDKP